MANQAADTAWKQTGPFESMAKDASALCKRTWWVFLIGGIASIAFGILAFMNPGIALLVLGMFFAAYLLVDGVANVWGALTQRDKEGWWIILLLGVLSVLLGGYLLVDPPVSMLALVFVVAFMAAFIGVSMLSLAWKIRRSVSNEWLLYLTGALSLLLGLAIVAFPDIGGLSVIYMIASWAVIIGVMRVWLAFRVRLLPERVDERLNEAHTAD